VDDLATAYARLKPVEQAIADWQMKWMVKRLPHQIPPKGADWTIWLLLAGRGAGKTRTAAEVISAWAIMRPDTRWLVSAPTYSDLTGVCFEGESGLINVIPPDLIETYNRSEVEIKLINGSTLKGITAEKPERFRGPQFHGGWLDELAAWQRADEAFDLLSFGMRLGDHPRLICTTTPKPNTIIRNLLAREGKDVIVTRASTYENLANLAPTFRDQILRYEGTTIGRQEIHAEVIDPEEMGVIKRSWVKLWKGELPELEFIVMSLDTAFTEETGSFLLFYPVLRGDEVEVVVLAIFAGLWGLIYGAIMNVWFWPFAVGPAEQYWQPGITVGDTLRRYAAFYLATSLVWDVVRALSNGLLTLAFGAPTLRALRRFKRRFAFAYQPGNPTLPEKQGVSPTR